MTAIEYKDGMKLVLMIKDSGGLDGFGIYLNGHLSFPVIFDQQKHRYDIDRPNKPEAVVIRFGGNDGGKSAIFDISVDPPRAVERQEGLTHAYFIRSA